MSWIIKLANFQTLHNNFLAEKAATSLCSAHSGQNKKSDFKFSKKDPGRCLRNIFLIT